MAVPEPHTIESWLALAAQWQQALQSWTAWWAGAGRTVPGAEASAVATTIRAPFDAEGVAALHAAFAPRVQALWAAPAQARAPADDRRFASAAWRERPYFAWLAQSYRLYGEFLTALASIAQLPPDEKKRLEFSVRQFVDAIAPTNFPATNPDVLARAIETEGASVVDGLRNLAADVAKGRITMSDESAFEVGRNLAVTPGSVVLRNDLIELIQYDATTPRVARRPLLIVPPCINKYYILDLKPANSFVRHAVEQGHTVFMISWRNVPAELGTLSWDDYLAQGVLAALTAVKAISRSRDVNTLGFCVGGTLLACALAVLAARNDTSASSVTFLTTMLDFADPGEIGVYVSRQMLAAREAQLAAGQRVHGSELAGAFASLRPNDLVWNYVVDNYLKGRKPPAFDLLYWNGDSANLPGPMYAYYIRQLYLENRLRERGALTMLGEKIDLSRVALPAYVYASRDDHIVPWRSAFRTLDLVGGETTFVLGASGHIAGVVNAPEAHKRNYWTHDGRERSTDAWVANATSHTGSWWPHWYRWLAQHRGGERAAPKRTGNATHRPLARAPGEYVVERVS
ncbi:MAG TPA: class I poly(R)-hydroxyalkanoic acid synthase [Casimicrobiaceae bacterium]|nr:class I poly(R)-hydroxyalkanoic acid synthase [Casimicrobiaceae bacterium]